MKHSPGISRRRFLKRTALATGAVAGAQIIGMPALLSAAEENAKLRVAVIGAGGMGGYSFDSAMKERLVAFCDVDDNTIAKKLSQFAEKNKDQPTPKTFFDYRKMLEECHRDIDVVC